MLIPLTILRLALWRADLMYIVGAAGLSVGFAWCGIGLVFHPSNLRARRLLLASIVYLPSAFGLAVLGKWW